MLKNQKRLKTETPAGKRAGVVKKNFSV